MSTEPSTTQPATSLVGMVDQVLKDFLEQRTASGGTHLKVSFEVPAEEYEQLVGEVYGNAPTLVNAFLYDIQEDRPRRAGGGSFDKDSEDSGTMRHAPRWYTLSYLLTARAKKAEDQHRVLSALLVVLPAFVDRLPELLRFPEQGCYATAVFGRPPADGRSLAEMWNALRTPPRPGLELAITVPVIPDAEKIWAVRDREFTVDAGGLP
ncbi:Pvc16 family protein [Streptomyces sp. NPDC001339]|uniref:Pvc16 family protein n=1 Tax=Streptomyces sp. NPDC001339 TaxID=3364563 RepID=UPI0036CDA2F4